MSFDFSTLITDRNIDDVMYVSSLALKVHRGTATEAEMAEWNRAALRGAYNYTDLNRVGKAVAGLAQQLRAGGYAPQVEPRMDWQEGTWMTPEAARKYLADVEELRQQFAQLRSTPETPETLEPMTLRTANAIEQILQDIEVLLQTALSIRLRSGQPLVFSGFAVYPQGTKTAAAINAVLGFATLGSMKLA